MAKDTVSEKVNPALEKAISDLLEEVMGSTTATITDKTKVIDRALKLEAIKQKLGPAFGTMFGEDNDDDKEDDVL